MKKEIVLSGVGGQGVVSVGEVMGLASLNEENINATMSASYGAEARGTFTKTDVVLSDGLVGYPNVAVPDLILCLARWPMTGTWTSSPMTPWCSMILTK